MIILFKGLLFYCCVFFSRKPMRCWQHLFRYRKQRPFLPLWRARRQAMVMFYAASASPHSGSWMWKRNWCMAHYSLTNVFQFGFPYSKELYEKLAICGVSTEFVVLKIVIFLLQMTHWFMGLQSLTAAHSARSLSLGRFLWCRVSLKIQQRARRLVPVFMWLIFNISCFQIQWQHVSHFNHAPHTQAVSPLQVVRDIFKSAGEFRRQQLVNPGPDARVNLSQTSLISDSYLGRSLFDRLFAWS